jgi:hypothetical protein
MRCQPPLFDKRFNRQIRRLPIGSCISPKLKVWIKTQMRTYNMSASWVIATALSYASGIEIDTPQSIDKARRALRAADSKGPKAQKETTAHA